MTIDDTDVEEYGDHDDDGDDDDHTYVTIPESTPNSSRLAKNAARPKAELPCHCPRSPCRPSPLLQQLVSEAAGLSPVNSPGLHVGRL